MSAPFPGEPDMASDMEAAVFASVPSEPSEQEETTWAWVARLTGGGPAVEPITQCIEGQAAELARLRSIIDRPDPYDFMAASEIEARFQLDKWGTTDGFPTAFDNTDDPAFAYLIGYLTGKVAATPDDNLDKKLHRVTTIAAAAANWHAAIIRRAQGGPDGAE